MKNLRKQTRKPSVCYVRCMGKARMLLKVFLHINLKGILEAC